MLGNAANDQARLLCDRTLRSGLALAFDSVERPNEFFCTLMKTVRIWDLPTRVFHWVLVLSLVGSVASAKIGGNAMEWHFRLGYLAAALLMFRLVWGVVGGRWSRFSSFAYTPGAMLRSLRGQPGPNDDVGHSPTGGLAVFAMLAILIVQVCTGLVADDEIASIGPLNRYVSASVAAKATGWHQTWGQWIVYGLVALHLAAIVFYTRVKRKRLVTPMVVGDKILPPTTLPSTDTWATRLLASVVLTLAMGVMWWVSRQTL